MAGRDRWARRVAIRADGPAVRPCYPHGAFMPLNEKWHQGPGVFSPFFSHRLSSTSWDVNVDARNAA
jgi:hypothetical protein